MGQITSTKTTPDNPTGLMGDDVDQNVDLVKKTEIIEDHEKKQTATEYWLSGELVHRSVHVHLKTWPEGMGAVIEALQ